MFKKNRLPRKGEKGFTLIELLVVVAILGVLAAVVVPNVSRFMGSGKTEAGETELHNVQLATTAMMAIEGLSDLTAAGITLPAVPTKDMTAFPDTAVGSDYVLRGGAGGSFIQKDATNYWFTVDTDGTVHGWWIAAGGAGNEIGVDKAP